MNPKLLQSQLSRRHFLRAGAGLTASASLLGTLGSFQKAAAATASTSGYRALVCLYLTGGNDGFNTIVPTTTAGYNTYRSSRGLLALSQSSLLSLNGTASDGYAYGMNASCPEMRTLFNAGHAAVICNVGPIVQPTTKAQVLATSAPLPSNLFSHVDQQTAWWTSVPNLPTRTGWAGRVADLYNSQGYATRVGMNITVGNANYWLQGANVTPYVLGSGGAPELFAANHPYRNGARSKATLDLIRSGTTDPNLLVSEYANLESSAIAKVGTINSALNAAGDLQTTFPTYPSDNGLGAQLHEVARYIKAAPQLGDTRHMFFVNIGGFDTHDRQLPQQATQLTTVSKNIDAFYKAMVEIGQQNNVTLFTASDFGRTISPNSDGADHAWGNHHIVVGGAVQPGYYGTMPSLVLGGADDIGNGRLVPTTSTDQYAATLAQWYGVAAADLTSIFPNLGNFGTRNLGFLA